MLQSLAAADLRICPHQRQPQGVTGSFLDLKHYQNKSYLRFSDKG